MAPVPHIEPNGLKPNTKNELERPHPQLAISAPQITYNVLSEGLYWDNGEENGNY